MTDGAARVRRLVGVAVLLLAVVGVLVVNRTSGPRVAGEPVAAWPQPPAVGSCLDLDGAGPRAVPCDSPHGAEVTRAYGPLDPMVTDTARDPMYDACDAAAHSYLGSAAAGTAIQGYPGWGTPGPAYVTKPLQAPADQRVGRYGWGVCAMQPAAPIRYTGTVRSVSDTDVPTVYRTCRGADGALLVSCALPHAAEVLAVHSEPGAWGWEYSAGATGGAEQTGGAGSAGDGDTSAQHQAAGAAGQGESDALQQANRAAVTADGAGAAPARLSRQCAEVAASVIGTGDPSYGGLLTVAVALGVPTGTTIVLDDESGSTSTQQGQTVRSWTSTVGCTVRAADGRLLAGSMVGWGDRRPPLTGG